jgi:DNA-binding Lrp family transcriptional regulator
MATIARANRRRRDWLDVAGALPEPDRDLLRLLRDDGRRPLEQLASDLGVAKRTVRRRIDDLESRGVIRIVAVARPEALGVRAVATVGVHIDGSVPLGRVAERVAAGRHVVYAAIMAGRYQVVAELWCAGEDDLLAAVEDVAAVPGVGGFEVHRRLGTGYQTPAFAACRAAPVPTPAARAPSIDELDARIIELLCEDGRVTYQALAGRLGVTDGHVRGRVIRLIEAGALAVTALADPGPAGFGALAAIAIRTQPGALASEVADHLADVPAVTHVGLTAGRFQLLADVAAADAADLLDVLESRLRRIGGIASIEAWTILRVIENACRYDTKNVRSAPEFIEK